MPRTPAICARCGRTRTVNSARTNSLCRDCSSLKIRTRDADALTGGSWKPNRAGIRVWVPTPSCHCGAPLVGISCDTCLRWAEKNAQEFEWAQQREANRGLVWDVLAMREQRRAA